jgi:pilus assembly protein CpaF
MLGGLPRAALHAQVLAALQVVLQVRRIDGGRVLESVSVLLPHGAGRLATVVPAWRRGAGAGPAAAALAQLLTDRGFPVPKVLLGPEPLPTRDPADPGRVGSPWALAPAAPAVGAGQLGRVSPSEGGRR